MINFPEILNFGKNIATFIEKVFTWIDLKFKFIFRFISSLIKISINLINEFLTKTPWWLWLLIITIFIIFKLIKKIKLSLIINFSIIIIWLLVFNVYFKNPKFGFNQNKFNTPWIVYILLIYYISYKLYNNKMAIALSSLLLIIGILGVWSEMILTLSIIIMAVIISILIGIPLGILMSRRKRLEKVMTPILDLLQTIPTFVYLIPAVMFFGIGVVPGTIATIIYALPPLVRLTYLGIMEVDSEVKEAGISFGSTNMQLLFKVELPQALKTIATGLNQTTMMAVSMVVTASMIGAGGLGAIVFDATQQNKIGMGFVGGFAIVALAIILDRIIQGITNSIDTKRGNI